MIKDIIEKGKERNIDIEVYSVNTTNTSIETLDERIKSFTTSKEKEFYIKAIRDSKSTFLYTEDISDVEFVLNLLEDNFENVDNCDADILATKSIVDDDAERNEININEIKNKLIDIDQTLKKEPLLKHATINYDCNYNEYELVNDKIFSKDYSNIVTISLELVVEKDNVTKSTYVTVTDNKDCFEKALIRAQSLLEDLVLKLNSQSCETKRYNILLKNNCVSSILSHFIDSFFGKGITNKLSVFSDDFNKKIFSDKITIIEDPTDKNLPGKRLFDSEGTETFYKEIIKDGVFVTKLYDVKNAMKDNVKSTGNKYGVRNLYIKPGDKKLEDLNEDGYIIIDEVCGTHAGIDVSNGKISLQAEGFIVENGKKTIPLNMIILTTDIYELFQNVKYVFNDLRFGGTDCGSPSLFIENITVSGSK